MSRDEHKLLWEEVQKQAKSALDVWKKQNNQSTSSSSSTAVDENADTQAFINEQLPKELCDILEHWHTNHSLDKTQIDAFKKSSEDLLKLTKHNSESSKWLSQQVKLIDLVKKCMDDIVSNSSYLDTKGIEDPSIESFDRLIQAFTNCECDQLLNVIVRCISNSSYNEILNNLSKVNAPSLTSTQHFLLISCPDYILTCEKDESSLQKVFGHMLHSKSELFTYFLPNIKKWTDTILLCLLYPIRFMLSNSDVLSFEEKCQIQKALVMILLKQPLSDSNDKEKHITLIHITLKTLLEIIRSDGRLLIELKKQTGKDSNLLDVLKQLSNDNHNERMQLHAFELISFLVPEEDFLKGNDSAKVTELFVKNFNEALEENKDREVEDLLQGLKGLVHSDEIKQQVVEQNALPSIMQYTKEVTDDPAPLQIAYALAFNVAAKTVLKKDQEFIDHVEKMKDSDNKDVANAAHGVMWKLEEEDKFKKEAEEHKSNEKPTEETKESKDDKDEKDDKDKPEQYDMMISYCWAQKELCHRINDRLEKDGYSVWLDRDEMRGSIVESMAEAVENSRCVLVCMSSNYKASTNCQAEAEYAFNRKSKIIPLMVEKDYKPDGWLGLMAGSKLYIDFAGKDDDEFDKAYELLIAEIKRRDLDGDVEDEKEKSDDTASTSTESGSSSEEAEPLPIQTREYLDVGPATSWSPIHVNEFLTDHELNPLLSICKPMDGETLIEFHHACETTPGVMYPVINKSIEGSPVPIDVFFKFIVKLKNFLPPPKPPSKVFFRYNFTYEPSATNDNSSKNTEEV